MPLPRTALTLVALGSAALALAQPAPLNQKDALGRKQGPWERTWAESEQLRYKGQFKDDRPVGTFTYFSTKGKVESTVSHYATGGASHGLHFHPNGKLMAEGRYVGEAKDSTWNYYDTAGKLRSTEHWKNGKREGEHLMYSPDGKVLQRFMYKNDQKNGLCQEFFEDGRLRNTSDYVDDRPEGLQTFYYTNGKKEIEGRNLDGAHDGVWTYYHDDGRLQIELLYKRGEFIKQKKWNGMFKEYYDSEQVKSEVTYVNGEREGPFVDYFDNGKWVERATKVGPPGYEVTQEERVLEGQTKQREGTYKDDLLEGEVVEYDEKGGVVKRTRYVRGVAQP